MIVHRLLDIFFRTLDTVDAARDRVDRALGREPRPDPWAVEWPPPGESPAPTAPGVSPSEAAPDQPAKPKSTPAKGSSASRTSAKATSDGDAAAPNKSASASSGSKSDSKAGSKKKGGRKKSSTSKRKGSVDRSGKDLDSPRARAVFSRMHEEKTPVITEDADLDGKKVLARVVWALYAAGEAGSEKGLTTNDVAALLSLCADIEVFATNIGRACRDHKELIAESDPDGRSKRYKLTPAGKKAAQTLDLQPMGPR